jgi:AraC-like DNA-binding protein
MILILSGIRPSIRPGAVQLLENSDEPISTICHRTGYQNLSNFNRQFRREYGITPGQYRRIHQHPELVLASSNPTQPEG